MERKMYLLRWVTMGALCAVLSVPAMGSEYRYGAEGYFTHLATFDVIDGNGSGVAEIVDVSGNGKQLVYTDGDNNQIGFVDISKASAPVGTGVVDVGGEPTSLVIKKNLVLVAVNTSPSFTEPSGKLVVVNRKTRAIVAEHELGGQPDSIALAPDQKRAAIVIENERDEDLGGGLLPQFPSGGLLVVDTQGNPNGWTISPIDLSAVAAGAFGSGDLEPEYVDINDRNWAVVSFQENNHLAVVDLVSGRVLKHFSAGSAMLTNVDNNEEDLISLDTNLLKRREPDAVTWVGNYLFATANEGDYEDAAGEEGGSRGFTLFSAFGPVIYESAESFEHVLVSAGHYNEGRSENKGVEPEAVEYAKYGRIPYLFVGSERSNAVGVYNVRNFLRPRLEQVLPTGMGPEGLKAIPQRNLFVVSTEADEADDGIPTMINIYKLKENAKRPRYPWIVSGNDAMGLPIPWVALSGLVGDPTDKHTLYAVSDSFLAGGFIYTIDTRGPRPATITHRLQVTGASTSLDLEGITVDDDGYFWVASEGRSGTRPNALLQVDPNSGAVMQEVTLPAALEDNARNNGFEGLAADGNYIYAAIQRAWPDTGDMDEVHTKIARYNLTTGEWGFVYYPFEPEGDGDWIGLSELTRLPDGYFGVIERDKGWGPTTGFNAELKSIFKIDLADAEFRAFDDASGLVTIEKELMIDVLPELAKRSIWTAEKLEGFAVAANGKMYVVTDNDGVDDAPGETVFFSLGRFSD